MFFDFQEDFYFDYDPSSYNKDTKRMLTDALNHIESLPRNPTGLNVYWGLDIDEFDYGPREGRCKEEAIIKFFKEGLKDIKQFEKRFGSVLMGCETETDVVEYFLHEHGIEEEPAPSVPMCY